MAKSKRPHKIRTDLRKNRTSRTRSSDLTRQYDEHGFQADESQQREQIGKDETTRRRTIIGADLDDAAGSSVQIEIDEEACLAGRVLSVGGVTSQVLSDDGQHYQCATRRLLKTINTDQRHVVAAGDRVRFRPAGDHEGMIERVEPRQSVICRTSRGRQHVMVANVDQLLIITSAAEPAIKPHLIDRLLVTAEKGQVTPIICVNKVDLIDPADLQPLVGVYGQLGYQVHLVSAETGQGVARLGEALRGRESVVAGQSGVGKSSLLNAVEPGFALRTGRISTENQKGRHTTSAAKLIPLSFGGFVVDTPGIRQFQLWDVTADEVASFFREIRPWVNRCPFPDCSHTHEANCAVKDAAADGHIDMRRYESYCHLHAGDDA